MKLTTIPSTKFHELGYDKEVKIVMLKDLIVGVFNPVNGAYRTHLGFSYIDGVELSEEQALKRIWCNIHELIQWGKRLEEQL